MLKSGMWNKTQNGKKGKGDVQTDGLELDHTGAGGEDAAEDIAVEKTEPADRSEAGEGNGQSGAGLWTGLQKGLQIKLDGLSLDKTFGLDVRSPDGDVLGFLDDVLGRSNDDSTQQARDAILAEGIRSLGELQREGTSVATLVEMGVPLPQARKLYSALESLHCDEGAGACGPPHRDTTEGSVPVDSSVHSKSSASQQARSASQARRASSPENTRSGATAYRNRSARRSLGAEEEEDAPGPPGGDGRGAELELTPQLREWLEGRGIGGCAPALLAQQLSDFSAMWVSAHPSTAARSNGGFRRSLQGIWTEACLDERGWNGVREEVWEHAGADARVCCPSVRRQASTEADLVALG
eukprot:2865194-Rhodomonas_salina.4